MNGIITALISLFVSIIYFIMGTSFKYNIISTILIAFIGLLIYTNKRYESKLNWSSFLFNIFFYSIVYILLIKNQESISPSIILFSVLILCLIGFFTFSKVKKEHNKTVINENHILLKNWNYQYYLNINNILKSKDVDLEIYLCNSLDEDNKEDFWAQVTINKNDSVLVIRKDIFDLSLDVQKMIILHEIGHYNLNHIKKSISFVNLYCFAIYPLLMLIGYLFTSYSTYYYKNFVYIVFVEILFESIKIMLNLIKTNQEVQADNFMIKNCNIDEIKAEDISKYVSISKEFLNGSTTNINLFLHGMFYGYPSKQHLLKELSLILPNEKMINIIKIALSS